MTPTITAFILVHVTIDHNLDQIAGRPQDHQQQVTSRIKLAPLLQILTVIVIFQQKDWILKPIRNFIIAEIQLYQAAPKIEMEA